MRWENERESSNVDDNRGQGGGFGGGRVPVFGRGRLSLGTLAVILIGGWLLGVNPLTLLGMLDGGVMPTQQQSQQQHVPSAQQQGGAPAGSDEAARFVRVVLGSTEDVWGNIFKQSGSQYRPPRLELFSGTTRTGCGVGQAGAGPFYCPADQRIYIDLSFFRVLQSQLGAHGDTAEAYVIAHEVGHHIQNLTGTLQKMEQARRQLGEAQYNQLSVRLELQADCYAGIWANHSQQAKNWFEAGDIEEAMNAAAAVGDDNIQGRSGGHVHQESFTHGTSQQRLAWFRIGFESGSVQRCDTFTNQKP
ncbi:MAG: neutral zinc metallopeptidase [Lautropia sp.]|nr:neutral zinc metallopeptidase [Lautropia sp.]